jgi:predicted O-methyltransferase YrrM
MNLLKTIHDTAFENTTILAEKEYRMFGWVTQDFYRSLDHAFEYSKNKSELKIIEVGSWQGYSANIMAQKCKESGKKGLIICIDTWLGSSEHQDDIERGSDGSPSIYIKFLENTKCFKNDDMIYPFPISSCQGGHYLRQNNIVADIIYIDGGHEYEAVLYDAKVFWEILVPGGVMIFDDYSWPNVKKAIDEFFIDKKECKIIYNNTQVVVVKI